ncbi:MAG: AAA family ATPase [Candidatus Buchananbacteria bacterium]
MADKGSCLPITEEALAAHSEGAQRFLSVIRWSIVTPKPIEEAPTANGPGGFRKLDLGEARKAIEISLADLAKAISGNKLFASQNANAVLNTIYQGLRIGSHLATAYMNSSGLTALRDANNRGLLKSEVEQSEFLKKNITTSAINLYGLAYYCVWKLKQLQPATLTAGLEYPGLPESTIKASVADTLSCVLAYFATFVRDSGKVQNDLDFINAGIAYFEKVLDQINQTKGSLEYTEPFTAIGYKLKDEDFFVRGFKTEMGGSIVSTEFKRVDIESIVGNRDAKHFFHRLAVRTVCYKIEEKRNIMHDLGGMSEVSMGFGIPGTGKTMMIGAFSTMLYDLCQWLELPYVFDPHPPNIVSTYQGGSRERAEEWWQRILNPNRISFGPADDAEVNYEDRTRQGVSAGVREVIGAALTNLEGASAIWRGNAVVFFLTNIPDQLDPAILSRIMTRFKIEGATTLEDIIDQDYLWWKRIAEIDPEFIAMTDPEKYEYLFAQRLVKSMAETYIDYQKPKEPVIGDIFNRVGKEHDITEQMFFGRIYQEVKKEFPKFSSRDIRNIQRAIDERLMDFDFPKDWMNNPETFFRQPYDRQKVLVMDLMRQNMKGKSFAEIRCQEAMRYLDGMVAIIDTGRRREIDRQVQQLLIAEEARKIALAQIQSSN